MPDFGEEDEARGGDGESGLRIAGNGNKRSREKIGKVDGEPLTGDTKDAAISGEKTGTRSGGKKTQVDDKPLSVQPIILLSLHPFRVGIKCRKYDTSGRGWGHIDFCGHCLDTIDNMTTQSPAAADPSHNRKPQLHNSQTLFKLRDRNHFFDNFI